ncbi:MAG TPA: CNNM domain-containing protein [Opitutales bacterium]|jgi:CBS domain containing-hemolysin-like protein|nr:CNNM domain-containing protein [Opitutales bacterium]
MILLLILTCATVLGISFVCSLTEAVLFCLNPLSLKLQHSRGVQVAGRWLSMKQRIERPVSAILVFNTLANTGLATLAGAIFIRVYGTQWLWLFSVGLTLAVLFGGELTPKILGVRHAERLASRLIGPLVWMMRICHPLVVLMEKYCACLKPAQTSDRNTSERILDIITLVQSAKAEQLLHNREEIIIIHAATLSARRVRTAMVPADSVHFFDSQKTLRDNVLAVGPKLHRSYPVIQSGTVVGYVRVRELLVQNLVQMASADWTKLVRPALHIDAAASLTQLLALFLEKSEIAALVDGAPGQLAGWITLDDVTQVLMGARI